MVLADAVEHAVDEFPRILGAVFFRDLDGFVARQNAEVGAAGEGVADLMDFDFSL